MKRNQYLKIVMTLWAALWCSVAQAAIIGTYTNAVAGPGGNTVRTSDSDPGSTSTWLWDGTTPASWPDDQWFQIPDNSGWSPSRTGFTILANDQTRGSTSNAPALTMTITAPNPLGIYNVYLVYQTRDVDAGDQPLGSTQVTPNYTIQAGLSPSSLTLFNSSGGYTGNTRFNAGAYNNEREVLLGVVTNSTISIYVDDSLQPSPNSNHTRWEGMAYLQIGQIPEPTAMLLLGVGGFALWRRSRK